MIPFISTTYGGGYGTVKDWDKAIIESGAKIVTTCEFEGLNTVIATYEKCLASHVKYIPSCHYSWSFNFNSEIMISSERVYFVSTSNDGYRNLIRLNNFIHKRFRIASKGNRSYAARACSEAVYQALYRKEMKVPSEYVELKQFDIELIVPLHASNLGNLLAGLYTSETEEEENSAIIMIYEELNKWYNAYDKINLGYFFLDDEYSNLPLFGYLKLIQNNGFKDRLRKLYDMEDIPLSSVLLSDDFLNFVVYDRVKFPKETDYEFAILHQQMLKFRADDFPFRSQYLKTAKEKAEYLSFEFGRRSDTIYCNESGIRQLIKKGIENGNKIFIDADFSIKLNEYRMPEFNIARRSKKAKTIKEFYNLLILKGWNKKVKSYRNGTYVGNWGEENNKIVKSLEELYSLNTDRSERLKMEYSVIESMGYEKYFVIAWDILYYCDTNNLERNKAGRGSGAGCFIAYLMDITGMDPMNSDYYDDLLFERFLNPFRATMPDIDLDFSPETRVKVLEYVRKLYGHQFVVQIGTGSKIKVNSALENFHRLYDYMLPKNSHPSSYMRIENAHSKEYSLDALNEIKTDKGVKGVKKDQEPEKVVEECVENSEVFSDFYDEHSKFINDCVIPICKNVQGFGRHASGFLVLPEHMDDCMPIRVDLLSNTFISQYEMEECEKAGYIKLDFLSIEAASILATIKRLVKETRGEKVIDFSELPLDDELAIREIKIDSTGIFQFKSNIQKSYQQKLNPSHFSDLPASVALCRTGPMKANAHLDYVKIKNGEQSPFYEHPSMINALKSTGGLIIYQEQILRLAQDMAGFSLGEADLLRRAIGKKKPEEMKLYYDKFIDGCVANNISEKIAKAVWEKIDYFSGYGFNLCVTGDTDITFYVGDMDSNSEFVRIPIMYAYLAMNAARLINKYVSHTSKFLPAFDREEFGKYLLDIMYNYYENNHAGYDVFHEKVMKSSKFRPDADVYNSLGYRKLVEIFESQTYGTTLSYHKGVAVRNNIIDIIRTENESPIVKICLDINGETIRVCPTHRFYVYSMRTREIAKIPAAQIDIGDYLICVDDRGVNNVVNSAFSYNSYPEDSTKHTKELSIDGSIFKYDGTLEEEVVRELFDNIPKLKDELHHMQYSAPINREEVNYPMDYIVYNENHTVDTEGLTCYINPVVSVDFETNVAYTYQVVMRDPLNNYFGNGILSCNSHAVSYSAISYYMAYLKPRYIYEYWCAILEHTHHDKKKPNSIYDYRRHIESIGVSVMNPNIHHVYFEFYPVYKDNASYIVWPISTMKGVGPKVIQTLKDHYGRNAGFESIEDMYVKCHKISSGRNIFDLKLFKTLLFADFFDVLYEDEDPVVRKGRAIVDYFRISGRSGKAADRAKSELVEKLMDKRSLWIEKQNTFSFICSSAKEVYEIEADDLDSVSYDSSVTIGGVLTRIRLHKDKNDNTMAFLTVEDYKERYNVVVFNDAYTMLKAAKCTPKPKTIVKITGRKGKRSQYGDTVLVSADAESEYTLVDASTMHVLDV